MNKTVKKFEGAHSIFSLELQYAHVMLEGYQEEWLDLHDVKDECRLHEWRSMACEDSDNEAGHNAEWAELARMPLDQDVWIA